MTAKVKNVAVVCISALFLFGFAAWGILQPDGEASLSERRPLAALPSLSAESIASGKFMADFEKYTLDQFPLRDRFRALKAITAFYVFGQKDNNDIYIKDGYVSKLDYPMNTQSVIYAAERFGYIFDRYLSGGNGNVYLSVIPDKNYFIAEPNGYPSIDYDKFIALVRENTAFAQYIDIASMLELGDYYRTDTHWRQDKITDVAAALAQRMGITLSVQYTVTDTGKPFYGVYYGQSALPLEADELLSLDYPALGSCKVFDFETNSYIPVYNTEMLSGNDPYEMFLSGSKSLLTIENPAAPQNRELIIFRDSFGSSIAPLLAEGYGKITLIDIRYISPAVLDRFVTFGNQDVLFLYSTSVLNNSNTIK